MNFELEFKRAEKLFDQGDYSQCANTCRSLLEAGLREIFCELVVTLKLSELNEAFAKCKSLKNPFLMQGAGTMIGFYAQTGLLEKHTAKLRIQDLNCINDIGKSGSHATESVSKQEARKTLVATEDFLNETGFKIRREFNHEEAFYMLVEMASLVHPIPESLDKHLKKKAVELGINRDTEERLYGLFQREEKAPDAFIQPTPLNDGQTKDEKTLQLMKTLDARRLLPMHYSEIHTAYENIYGEDAGDINGRLADGSNPEYGYASTGTVVYHRARRGFYKLAIEPSVFS